MSVTACWIPTASMKFARKAIVIRLAVTQRRAALSASSEFNSASDIRQPRSAGQHRAGKRRQDGSAVRGQENVVQLIRPAPHVCRRDGDEQDVDERAREKERLPQ